MAVNAFSTLAHTMPVAPRALSATAAVRASLDTRVLESKSLGELRALARQRGLRGDTKAELVKMLSSGTNGAFGATPAAPVTAEAPSAAQGATQSAQARQLEAMPLAQLRAMARSRGIFGNTKAELVAALLAASGAPAAAPAAPAAAPPPAPGAQYSAAPSAAAPAGGSNALARQLESMPMGQLRAMARQKGLRGNTKDELISALLGTSSRPSSYKVPIAAPSASSPPPAPAAPSAPAPAPASPSAPAAAAVNPQALSRQLQARPLSALRAMASAKGISPAVSSKDQLVRALIAAATATAAGVTEVRAAASVRSAELQARPLSELRAMARQRGLRGDTKAELVKLLTASDPTPNFASTPTTPPRSATATATATTTATAAAAVATATATATPFSSGISIPFQSDAPAGGTTAIQPAQSATAADSEAPSIQEAIELFFSPDRGQEQQADGLSEQAAFLRNVMVAGIGVAVLPLILPMQMPTPVAVVPSSSPPAITAPVEPVAPPPEPEPEVRELSPAEFCRMLPASLLSPEAARFCAAVADMKL
ncbi:unnamed protein product [Closterium sp. NIES-65]|nr:unnamed protein product [Closterium sp. NIES-65]